MAIGGCIWGVRFDLLGLTSQKSSHVRHSVVKAVRECLINEGKGTRVVVEVTLGDIKTAIPAVAPTATCGIRRRLSEAGVERASAAVTAEAL